MRVTIPAQTFEVPAAGGTVQVALTVMPVGGPVEPPPPPPPPPPPVGTHPTLRAAPFIGYGVVNRWPWIDPERLAKALYEAGLTFTAIEWIPWWKSMTDGVNASSTTGGFVTTTYPTEARAFIETMTRYSITTFVIMRNWNSEAEQRMSDDDFRRDLQALQNIAAPADMLPTGRPVVCVEGVSEPSGSGKHMAWNRMVSDEWYRKGGKTLANRSGEQAGPFTWGDYHWCQDFTEANAKAALNNTDCGPVINPGPARSAKMTRAAINRDVGFLVYDFHKGPPELPEGIDFATIAAMGVEIQKGGKGTYVWNPGAPTTPDTPPTGDADAIDVQQLEWIRPWESDASDFVKTVRLTGVTADAGRIGFNTNGGLVGWPNGTVDAAPANFLSFVLIDGKWCGGTWEWMGANTGERRMSRNLSWHIAGGDGPGNPLEQKVRNHPVKSGDMVAVMVASCCRKPGDRPLQPGQRSNIVLVRMA